MRKWRCGTFLHTVRFSLFLLMSTLYKSSRLRTTATLDLGRASQTSEGRKFELVPKAPQFELQFFFLCCVLKRLGEQLGSPTSAVSDSCLVLFLCGFSQRVSLVVFCYSSARCLGFRVPVLWFCAGATLLLRGLQVRVFLEYVAIDVLKFERALGPSRNRGEIAMARSAACCTPYNRHCPLFLVQSQPAELPATTVGEGGGDATPCEDTREERVVREVQQGPKVTLVVTGPGSGKE